MKRLVAAVMFLTRLPVPGKWNLEGIDVGRATAFFPLVGAGIGAMQCGVLAAAGRVLHWMGQRSGHFHAWPAPILAVIIVALGVLITGALHLDGIADMSDGFGGGRSREDVLRIMRDHAIGAYGSIALTLVLIMKVASISTLIEQNAACRFLVIAPALGRASAAVLGFMLPYARSEGGLGRAVQNVGIFELFVSSLTAVGLAVWLIRWQAVIPLLLFAVVTISNIWLCKRKIQGITGDTIGANIELSETLVLAAGAILVS